MKFQRGGTPGPGRPKGRPNAATRDAVELRGRLLEIMTQNPSDLETAWKRVLEEQPALALRLAIQLMPSTKEAPQYIPHAGDVVTTIPSLVACLADDERFYPPQPFENAQQTITSKEQTA